MDYRISADYEYGVHIPLTCANHPNLRWSTKNIDFIGARSLFYRSWEDAAECDCPVSALVVVGKEQQ